MKKMKKLMALAVSMIMALAMVVTAFAEETTPATTYSITAPQTAHQYEIYQIFTGTYGDGKLNDVHWGANGTGTEGAVVESSVLQEIQNANSEAAILAAVKKNANLSSTLVAEVTNGSSYAAVPGYYLIKDKDNSVSGNDAYTLYLVKVVNAAVAITPKTGTPTVEKKVKDTNDSTGVTTEWQDSADFDIGDTISYQLTATMGDLSHYDHYYVNFVDTMTHLTYTAITSVKVGDNTLTSEKYTVTWSAEDKKLQVEIMDVKALGAVTGTKVVVEYTATLDADAAIGSAGNPNEVYLEFSNNPNNTGDGSTRPDKPGETPKDKNIVFTYKVVANKVTADNQALAGAAFELFKKDKNGDYQSLGVKGATKDGETWVADDNTTSFAWTGIDDGAYKLEEVVTPTGYNAIEPIEFTVSATHDTESADPKLTALTGGDLFTGNVSTGALTGDIINRTGTTLPETGGIGTTIFYAAGAILVLGAVIVLITKKRMSAQK